MLNSRISYSIMRVFYLHRTTEREQTEVKLSPNVSKNVWVRHDGHKPLLTLCDFGRTSPRQPVCMHCNMEHWCRMTVREHKTITSLCSFCVAGASLISSRHCLIPQGRSRRSIWNVYIALSIKGLPSPVYLAGQETNNGVLSWVIKTWAGEFYYFVWTFIWR